MTNAGMMNPSADTAADGKADLQFVAAQDPQNTLGRQRCPPTGIMRDHLVDVTACQVHSTVYQGWNASLDSSFQNRKASVDLQKVLLENLDAEVFDHCSL